MKKTKTRTKTLAMLLSLALAAGFSSCDSNDDLKEALPQPNVTQTGVNYQSLSFSWDKVDGAVQYGYRLIDPIGRAVAADVTKQTSVRISGLQPSTTYTLQVWPFAAVDGSYSTPPAITLTATTDALTPLPAPELTIVGSDRLEVSWNSIPGAKEYSYTVVKDGTVTAQGVTTAGNFTEILPAGTYTVSVMALGNGRYADSPMATATATLNVTELYSVTGLYYSAALDKSWEAKMTAYSNGAYTIFNYYGVRGYNLDFADTPSNSSDRFSFLNGERVYDETMDYTTWQVPTGSWLYPTLIAYPWSNYCSVSGNADKGQVEIGNYYGPDYANWGEDLFVWPKPADDDPMQAIVGSYTNHFVGGSSLFSSDWTWEDFDVDNWSATIKKVDEEYVEIDGILFTGYPVYGLVDFEARTITIEPQDGYYDWYTFASADSPTESVVGTINEDGSITFPDFAVWYDFDEGVGEGDWYFYAKGTSTLTK